MTKKIIFITGGQRSGKSVFAENMALSLSSNPIYMATAHIWDDDFAARVKTHQQRRGPQWENIEEEKELSKHYVTGRVVLIDCCTLWATNYFFELNDISLAKEALKEQFDQLTVQDATFIFVSNEIGMGGVSANEVQRKFTDLLGWLNQYVAANANDVYLMVSGISVKIK